MAEATPALEIRDLHKRYGDLEVLKGISLTARDGDVISILGSSGSGKSTFLRCINLLENPHQGQILVAGEELKLKPAKNGDLVAADSKQINRLRSEIGFVFQNFNLWPHMSILDNIIEAPRRVLGQSKASHSGTNRRGWPKSNRPRCSRALSRVTPISRLPSSSLPSAAQLLSQQRCRPSTSRGSSNNQGCSGLNTQANQPS